MKIAIHNAQFSSYVGGTERLIHNHLKNLLDYPDIHVTLVTRRTRQPSLLFNDVQGIKKDNFKIIEVRMRESPQEYTSNNPLRWHIESLDFGLAAQPLYFRSLFDLVITHFSTDSLFIPRQQTNVLHLHGVPSHYSEIGEISARRPDFFVSVSQYVKDQWTALYPFMNRDRVSVVYPGIDSRVFVKKPLPKVYDLLFVGRFISIKGIDTLIDAVASIKQPLKICLIGDGPDKDSIIEKIRGYKLEDQFTILSKVHDEGLVNHYNLARIGVFPSYAKEGVLLTMLEAASCGLPIITSRACSMPEFLRDGENGLLFEPRNYHDLAHKIVMLLSHNDLRKRLGSCAEKNISASWDTTKRVRELYTVYTALYHATRNTS